MERSEGKLCEVSNQQRLGGTLRGQFSVRLPIMNTWMERSEGTLCEVSSKECLERTLKGKALRGIQ